MKIAILILATIPATLFAQRERLEPDDPIMNGVFGHAVDMDRYGDLGLVGSPVASLRDDVEDYGGATYLLMRQDSRWSQKAKLVPIEGGRNDAFGTSVALSGDGRFALIGAPLSSRPGFATGAAYIFQCDHATCVEQALLEPPVGQSGDLFGRSVAIDQNGSVAVVGAVGRADFLGSAWVFQHQGPDWRPVAELLPDDQQEYGAFGHSVAISSGADVIWVGEPLHSGTFGPSGAVHVYRLSNAGWQREDVLYPDAASRTGMFGYSLDLAFGSQLGIVGAPDAGRGDNSSGSATLFSRQDGAWTAEHVFEATSHDEAVWFAASVSIDVSGSFVLVGAPGDYRNGSGSGRGFVFAKWNDAWSLARELEPDSASQGQRFGNATALSATAEYALVGAREDASNAFDAGLVFAFGPASLPVLIENVDPGNGPDSQLTRAESVKVSVYPNPASELARFSIYLDHPQHLKVEGVDLNGRLAALIFDGEVSNRSTNLDWEMSGLPPGLYIVRFTGDSAEHSISVVHTR